MSSLHQRVRQISLKQNGLLKDNPPTGSLQVDMGMWRVHRKHRLHTIIFIKVGKIQTVTVVTKQGSQANNSSKKTVNFKSSFRLGGYSGFFHPKPEL